VDLVKGENVEIEIKGRHDACIVPRAVPCIESVVAIAILDEILGD
jgi:chorismate synthase